MSWQKFEFTIKGDAPLLMHNGNLVDPENPHSVQIEELNETYKRNKKSKAYISKMMQLEWEGGLYLNNDNQIVIPPLVMFACLASRGSKKAAFNRSFDIVEDGILQYDGPRDLQKLYEERNHFLKVPVRITTNKVMRTRPMFINWGASFKGIYNSELKEKDIRKCIDENGQACGLGDWRPRYGRFSLVEIKF